jgi:hypothetical protein
MILRMIFKAIALPLLRDVMNSICLFAATISCAQLDLYKLSLQSKLCGKWTFSSLDINGTSMDALNIIDCLKFSSKKVYVKFNNLGDNLESDAIYALSKGKEYYVIVFKNSKNEVIRWHFQIDKDDFLYVYIDSLDNEKQTKNYTSKYKFKRDRPE